MSKDIRVAFVWVCPRAFPQALIASDNATLRRYTIRLCRIYFYALTQHLHTHLRIYDCAKNVCMCVSVSTSFSYEVVPSLSRWNFVVD